MDLIKEVRSKRKKAINIYPYVLIFPGLFLICLILVYPLTRGIMSSFFAQEFMSLGLKKFIGLQQYERLAGDPSFWMTLKNTAIWVVAVVILQYLFGLSSALLLNRDFRGRGLFRSLILIPWVIPTIAGALSWQWIYDFQYGVLNYVLKAINVTQRGFDWIGGVDLALPSVIVVAVWKAGPFVTITLLAALQAIDRQLYEVADLDGAGIFRKFWHITMPGIKEVTITSMLLRVIWTFNQFDIVNVMTNGGPANSSMILPVYTYLTAFSFNELNYAAAIACVGLLLIGVVGVYYVVRNSRGMGVKTR